VSNREKILHSALGRRTKGTIFNIHPEHSFLLHKRLASGETRLPELSILGSISGFTCLGKTFRTAASCHPHGGMAITNSRHL
jgi:hypothetical protein